MSEGLAYQFLLVELLSKLKALFTMFESCEYVLNQLYIIHMEIVVVSPQYCQFCFFDLQSPLVSCVLLSLGLITSLSSILIVGSL